MKLLLQKILRISLWVHNNGIKAPKKQTIEDRVSFKESTQQLIEKTMPTYVHMYKIFNINKASYISPSENIFTITNYPICPNQSLFQSYGSDLPGSILYINPSRLETFAFESLTVFLRSEEEFNANVIKRFYKVKVEELLETYKSKHSH